MKRGIIKNINGQGIIEFMILFGVVLFFFVGFMLIIQNNISDKNIDKERQLAQGIALSVKSEISIAAESSDGYLRTFTIPNKLIGKEYNIQLTDDRVYLSADRIGISYKINNVTGYIQKGENAIRKKNGTIYLNA